MQFSDSVRTGVALLRHRTGDVLPVFLAGPAAGVVGQSVVTVAALLAYLSLRGTGRIPAVLEAGRRVDFVGLTDEVTTPAERALFDAIGGLFTPTVLLITLGVLVVAPVVLVVVRGLTAAAKVHVARALVADEPPVVAAVRGARADALTFVGFVLLQAVLGLGPLVVGGVLALAVGGAAGVALFVLAVLVWIPVLFALYVGLLFAREAIVVEGVGLLGGIRHNLSFIAANPARALLYVLFEVGVLLVAGMVTNVLSLLGVSRVGALVSVVFVLPLLGLVKMAVYVDADPPAVARGTPAASGDATPGRSVGATDDRGPERPDERGSPDEGPRTGIPADEGTPTTTPDDGADEFEWLGEGSASGEGSRPDEGRDPDAAAPVGGTERDDHPPTATGRPPDDGEEGRLSALASDLRSGLGAGWAELLGFSRARPGLIAVALLIFCVGVAGGYAAAAPLGIDVTGGGTGGGFGLVPLDAALQISANNWLVAVAQTYAGIALGVPAAVNLLFNGLLVGGLAGLGFDLRLFAALVVPHALLEVPALAISGAVGLHLAGRALAFARGRRPAEEFAEDLRVAFRVLVGLLPVFVVAGFVEAFLTPLVGELVRAAIGG